METKNHVQLCGYVVRDPDSKLYSTGHRVALQIATPVEAEHPALNDGPNSHAVIAWDELADQAVAEFAKGSRIEVEGRLAYRSYTDADGRRRLFVFVKAQTLNHPKR